MDPINMTGETGRPNTSSVFGFDQYPPLMGMNWNETSSFPNPLNPTTSNMCVPNQVPLANLQSSFAPVAQQIGNIPAAVPSTLNCLPGMNIPAAIHPFGVPTYPEPQTSYSFGTVRPMPEVMQFPFHSSNNMTFTHGEFRCKRKTDSPPLQPAKQHITEEKMAEHMSKLHISSETPTVSETESSKIRRLYMCEEMRKLQTESIIPKSLLDKIERPCTALVLWKPPASRWVPPSAQNDEVDENDNNNTEVLPENNMVDMLDDAASNMEMDNC